MDQRALEKLSDVVQASLSEADWFRGFPYRWESDNVSAFYNPNLNQLIVTRAGWGTRVPFFCKFYQARRMFKQLEDSWK